MDNQSKAALRKALKERIAKYRKALTRAKGSARVTSLLQNIEIREFAILRLDWCPECGGEEFIPAGPDPHWMIPCPLCTPGLGSMCAVFLVKGEKDAV